MAPASDSGEMASQSRVGATVMALADLELHNGNGKAGDIKAGELNNAGLPVKSFPSAADNGGQVRSGYVPYGVTMVERKPPCILGMGTAHPDNIYKMEDFAAVLNLANFNCPPEAANFTERICKQEKSCTTLSWSKISATAHEHI